MASSRKHILMIAFDFPPRGGAGIERTVKFAYYLRNYGWEPIILTVNTETHSNFLDNRYSPERDFKVFRTFCLDASKHLAIKGRYLSVTSKPDRFLGWLFTALPKALKIIREYDIKCIWSTYPILTSHIVGYCAHRVTKLPWIADYRDPLQCHYDESVYHESKVARFFERLILPKATKLVFTNTDSKKLYEQLYGSEVADKSKVIENGFDSSNFEGLTRTRNDTNFIMFHGGSLYETGRQPFKLFEALSIVCKRNIESNDILLQLVGANNEAHNRKRAESFGINKIVQFLHQRPYSECMEMMLNADLLVVIQGKVFNNQIPGKIYEYLSTQLPVIVVTPFNSATGKLVRDLPGVLCSEDVNEIAEFIALHIDTKKVYQRNIEKYERRERAKLLAQELDSCVENN